MRFVRFEVLPGRGRARLVPRNDAAELFVALVSKPLTAFDLDHIVQLGFVVEIAGTSAQAAALRAGLCKLQAAREGKTS